MIALVFVLTSALRWPWQVIDSQTSRRPWPRSASVQKVVPPSTNAGRADVISPTASTSKVPVTPRTCRQRYAAGRRDVPLLSSSFDVFMFRPKGTAGASSTAGAQPNPTADFVRISSKTVLHKHVYRTGHAQVDLTARITLSYSD